MDINKSNRRLRPIRMVAAAFIVVSIAALLIWFVNASGYGSKAFYPISGNADGTPAANIYEGNVSQFGPGVSIGAPAPDFQLQNVNGGAPVTLLALRGKPVWINFWATWCPPCKAELPRIKQEYDKYKDEGLIIVGIDMREDPGMVNAFTQQNSFDWTFVVDGDGVVTDHYFTPGIPTHIFIDRSGVIRGLHVGELDQSSMDKLLNDIVGGN